MFNTLLSKLSNTPEYVNGLRAYDVTFYRHFGQTTADHSAVLIYPDEPAAETIRIKHFTAYPDTVDYTPNEFDYRAFQVRTAADRITYMSVLHLLGSSGELADA